MSFSNSPRSSTLGLPLGLRSRRGSLASLVGDVDKERLSQALDDIHNKASQSGSLTTFNEYADPPTSSSGVESKGLASDLVHNGLSGLYTRLKGAVGASKDKVPAAEPQEDGGQDRTPFPAQSIATRSAVQPRITVSNPREAPTTGTSVPQLPKFSSRVLPPVSTTSTAPKNESLAQGLPNIPSSSLPSASKPVSSSKAPISTLKKATSVVASVNVIAFKDVERVDESSNGVDGDASLRGQAIFDKVSLAPKNKESHPPPSSAGAEAEDSGSDSDVDFRGITTTEGNRAFRSAAPDRSDLTSVDGVRDWKLVPGTSKTQPSADSALQIDDTASPAPFETTRRTVPDLKRPLAIERITQSHLPGYHPSRASSTDRSTAETSPINTSAHGSIRHGSFSIDEAQSARTKGSKRIPGTTLNEGDPEAVNARLEQMRKQVQSKEFWMADEICKECFLCGDPFTAFRRKHHCRTCGCIFDSKCTLIVSGERFGVQGNLRICKTCLDIINRRYDSSDESADESVSSTTVPKAREIPLEAQQLNEPGISHGTYDRPLTTPMMAIPATRRIGDSSNRRSAVLEIDAPQLSRPSSSRSLKSLTSGRPASGHKRQQSKHNFLGRFKLTPEERAPFRRHPGEELRKKSKLPTFHDDNIIDPDLAAYMSDDGSSGDEQTNIFSTMNSGSLTNSIDNDRPGFGSLTHNSKKHRSRVGGEKSISGMSFASLRGAEDGSLSGPSGSHPRPSRRRNLSTSSSNIHNKGPARHLILKGFGGMTEDIYESSDTPQDSSGFSPQRMTRSASMKDARAPVVELNNASLHHVRRLLRQLLQDANIPNISSWEKALIPILLQCTDDVNPDVRRGDDIDIRHYVKLKKVPGGRPGDTSYVSGVVFTKNLALKSMPRNISHPRIVIVSFPIEYQRYQQHFMSLDPVIAQEKEFLRNMVNRIASLRPQLLLVQKQISGLALQYLADANIAVAYNVKQSVIEAVSRCAQTEIISSIDMVTLKPIQVGKSAGFDVKTFVHGDIPGKKKTCISISGCSKELGCTIVLRGANMAVLSKMKRITEFMVYVVYNLKLETCLMRDEFVLIPSVSDDSGSVSHGNYSTSHHVVSTESAPKHQLQFTERSNGKISAVELSSISLPQHLESQLDGDRVDTEQVKALHNENIEDESLQQDSPTSPKIVSAHQSHMHGDGVHDDSVPDDTPMPTFYSDMVAKHQTKILSASPFVKFMQPYLLVRAREQERRLVYLKRLRDQDTFEERSEAEEAKPQNFQLILPEMVHSTVQKAPKQIMEVLHAVHDAEYDKALHNYQTQKRQWENYIQGNINLFDPYVHQNIVVLYTVVCTTTSIPCAGPDLLALAFYNEHESSRDFDPDCTLGQYVEDLCLTADAICTSNGCERRMSEHHRTYVHGEARITVFVEKSPSRKKTSQDTISMWSYCKICKKDTQVMPMSESTWKYSFGKYLELSFWSSELHLRAGDCQHDLHRDHLRYFGFRNVAMRLHYDPIDLLEIVVPRTRITWKVDKDLRLKNESFTKVEERLNRFMSSVKARIKGINVDTVIPEKADACKVEIEELSRRAQDEHAALLQKLQDKYMESKYYEIIPLNRAVRALQEKVAEWDAVFADFDANFFPSEKDIRRLAAVQLKKMFMDRDTSTSSLVSTDNTEPTSDVDEKALHLDVHADDTTEVLQSVTEEVGSTPDSGDRNSLDTSGSMSLEHGQDRLDHLDLAIATSPEAESLRDVKVYSNEDGSSQNSNIRDGNDREISAPTLISGDSSLSEKIQQLRKASLVTSGESSDPSGIPRPIERGAVRRNGVIASPPMSRTQSQPSAAPRRLLTSSNKPFGATESTLIGTLSPEESLEPLKTIEPIRDKKFAERLGLALKPRKGGHSFIPRSIHGKKKDSKVSTLAKHFEQLSREFEKERLRDRKQRAAKVTQSRAFPKASSKPIVDVYRDVDEAVEEQGQSEYDILHRVDTNATNTTSVPAVGGLAALNTNHSSSATHSRDQPTLATEETATEAETDDNQPNVSQNASDEEAAGSDIETSMSGEIPSVSDIADSLAAVESSGELEIPKHERSSLMKMLSTFWAERSASGWTQLEYPLNATDHVFVDSDVIVREDEPSSLIAFALSSEDYIEKLRNIRQHGKATRSMSDASTRDKILDPNGDNFDQAEVETSLLRATGTHLKYQFAEGSAKMLCKIFYAEQFDAVRRKCGVADRIVESLSRCLKWDSKGGKTKSVFLKTLDDRLVLKSLSPVETQAFLRFAPAYFNVMAEALFHDLPTVIAKMLGFYQIVIKNSVTGTEIKWDVLVMENLFYDRSPTRIFDLKGSMRNRKIQSTGEQNEVLLDENMVEFIYESPLFAREHSKKLLRASVYNDTLFLARQDVMDYSLMVAVDEKRKELVVGIIDCIRTYTWDKKLESWIKDRGFAGGGRNRPTVTSPKEYKSRFREAMARYVLQAPNCWHQFSPAQLESKDFKSNSNRDGPDGEHIDGDGHVDIS